MQQEQEVNRVSEDDGECSSEEQEYRELLASGIEASRGFPQEMVLPSGIQEAEKNTQQTEAADIDRATRITFEQFGRLAVRAWENEALLKDGGDLELPRFGGGLHPTVADFVQRMTEEGVSSEAICHALMDESILCPARVIERLEQDGCTTQDWHIANQVFHDLCDRAKAAYPTLISSSWEHRALNNRPIDGDFPLDRYYLELANERLTVFPSKNVSVRDWHTLFPTVTEKPKKISDKPLFSMRWNRSLLFREPHYTVTFHDEQFYLQAREIISQIKALYNDSNCIIWQTSFRRRHLPNLSAPNSDVS